MSCRGLHLCRFVLWTLCFHDLLPTAALIVPADGAGPYSLSTSYLNGGDFLSRWAFWTAPDPTHGFVEFVSRETAAAHGLLVQSPDKVKIGVDMTTQDTQLGRKSVRMHSVDAFNSGLFVARIEHAPTGCGTWPAFWMYGEDKDHVWPTWGEFDIIESVHTAKQVMTSLHTGHGCDQSHIKDGRDFSGSWAMTGSVGSVPADNCDISAADQSHNSGCSQLGPVASIGDAFNAQGGGTYAAEWDPEVGHMRTWFFPPGAEPADLAENQPNPASWGRPYSFFSLSPETCAPQHFVNMHFVLDVTFCGELGEAYYSSMCPKEAESMSCQDFVAKHPERMREAYWLISTLDVYQRTPGVPLFFDPKPQPPAKPPPSPEVLRPGPRPGAGNLEPSTQRPPVAWGPPPSPATAAPTLPPVPWGGAEAGPSTPGTNPPASSPEGPEGESQGGESSSARPSADTGRSAFRNPTDRSGGSPSEATDQHGNQRQNLAGWVCGASVFVGLLAALGLTVSRKMRAADVAGEAAQGKRGLAMYEEAPSPPDERVWVSLPFHADLAACQVGDNSGRYDSLDKWPRSTSVSETHRAEKGVDMHQAKPNIAVREDSEVTQVGCLVDLPKPVPQSVRCDQGLRRSAPSVRPNAPS